MYYKQLCRKCQVGFNPYRVEPILCKVQFSYLAESGNVWVFFLFFPVKLLLLSSLPSQGCSQTCCSCEKKQRHINMKRPHRQDLCCRCKGMRLSCDATYSFKYIVWAEEGVCSALVSMMGFEVGAMSACMQHMDVASSSRLGNEFSLQPASWRGLNSWLWIRLLKNTFYEFWCFAKHKIFL